MLESVTDPNDVLVVYSNQPAKKMFFRDKYARTIVPGQSEVGYTITVDGRGNTINVRTYINGFRRSDATTVGTSHKIPRTVDGVMGTIRCAGSSLTSGVCGTTSDGNQGYTIDNLANWTFFPNDANAFFYDPYLYFGWWMDVAPPAGSEAFDVFYKAVGFAQKTTTAARGDSLTGTATYEGGAAGQYAIRALGVENGSRSGDFVADVTLNANFDVDPTPANTSNNDTRDGIALSGAINNFRADYEGSTNWVVMLSVDKDTQASSPGVQPLDNLAQTGANVGYTTTWGATGSTIPLGEGKWNVDFYGTTNNVVPDAAVGKFAAGASNRAILMGSFGATKKTGGQ